MIQKSHLVLFFNKDERTKNPQLHLGTPLVCSRFSNMSDVLNKTKDEIEKVPNNIAWDYCKKLTNEYELLHTSIKNKTTNIGITNYDPISRAFYKFWELVEDFHLLLRPPPGLEKTFRYVALCEGPGGFIECFNYYRRKQGLSNDKIWGITLKSFNDEVPGWKKSYKILNECPNIQITYGEDDTGDLYNVCNLIHLRKTIQRDGGMADMVSADGGFDVSDDYSHQETKMFRLLFAEIIGAFSVLNTGGTFVLKIFDFFYELTIDLLYLLTTMFDKVIITKPFTSRPANSERYLVCRGFKGIDESVLNHFWKILWEWDVVENQGKMVSRLFDFTIPESFLENIESYNCYHLFRQVKNIMKTLELTKIELSNEEVSEFKKYQVGYGILWCNQYRFPINSSCKYLSDSVEYNFIPHY